MVAAAGATDRGCAAGLDRGNAGETRVIDLVCVTSPDGPRPQMRSGMKGDATPPPLRISYLWKRDPLDPTSMAVPILTFPVSRKLSTWVTSSSGKSITYEEVFTEEEEAARLAAEVAHKASLRRELERKLKLSAASAAAEAKAASLGPLQKQAEAAVRVLESAWTDPVSRRALSLSPGFLPRTSRALHAELDRRGYSSELERLPSPQREDKRLAASESRSESRREMASSSVSTASLFRPDASIRRHQRTTRPRQTLDIRPLKLGTYNTGETSEVSHRDLAVLAVIKESRKSRKKALDGSGFLVQAERDLFDSQYSRHICQVLDIQKRSRYKTEAEKQAIREARRYKTDEWRAKK